MFKDALFYTQGKEGRLKCFLCPHHCNIPPQGCGICGVRKNDKGRLLLTNYGEVGALALDPIEKKPLYHFYPGEKIFSAGAPGCNLDCRFCQNWTLAHAKPQVIYLSPGELINLALEETESLGIAFTYSEPLMWYEYILDCLPLAKEAGLKVVMVSNGYIEPEPLAKILPLIDAWNVDLKGFNEDFYRRLTKGKLAPVLRTLKMIAQSSSHLEITTLLIPGLNDAPEEIEKMAAFIAQEISPDCPLHFSRYFPAYKLDLPPTPEETLLKSWEIARKYLRYVYLGNVSLAGRADTYCPHCGNAVIKRQGYRIDLSGLKGNSCVYCGAKLSLLL
jgi:pyruvate formate lyase activating enzyme